MGFQSGSGAPESPESVTLASVAPCSRTVTLTLPFDMTIAGWPSKTTVCADTNPAAANQDAADLKLSMKSIIRYILPLVQVADIRPRLSGTST